MMVSFSSWTVAATTLFLLLRPALSQIPPQYASHFLPNTTLQITYGNYTISDGEILPHTLTARVPAAALLPPPPSNETVALVLVDAETNTTYWMQTDLRPVGGAGKNATKLVAQVPAQQDYRPPGLVEIGVQRYVFLAFSRRHGKRVGMDWWRSEEPVAGAYFKVGNEKSTTNSSEDKTFGHEPSEADTPMPITLVPVNRTLSERSSAAAVATIALGGWGVFAIAVAAAASLAM